MGCPNRDKKQPQTKRLHFTCGQLQLLTSNYNNQGNWGTSLMDRRVRQRAVGCSQKRLTSCFQALKKSRPNSQNRKNTSFHVREPIIYNRAMAKSPMKKQLSPKVCYSILNADVLFERSEFLIDAPQKKVCACAPVPRARVE